MIHFRSTFQGLSLLLLLFLCLIADGRPIYGQDREKTQDEIIKVNTDLIQLDVIVLDKDGRFVKNLTRDQFELQVNGKSQPVQFFEAVSSQAERLSGQQLTSGKKPKPTDVAPSAARSSARGRSIIFFVDDVHLSFDSIARTRSLILKFIDEEMSPDDHILIATTTNQLGFLQQPTSDKVMLSRAASKLNSRLPFESFERQPPPMSKYEALAVERRERDAFSFFVDEMLRLRLAGSRATAEAAALERAHTILAYANIANSQSFAALEQVTRSFVELPGRKLAFFISDGFFLDLRNSNASDRLRRIADLAAKNGVVVYSIDARGLSTGQPDASKESRFDKTRRLQRINIGELQASQEVLHKVAEDTGGRAFVNNNDLSQAVKKGLGETAEYYMVAWQRREEDAEANKFRRVKLTIKDRPELRVLTQSGYFTTSTADEQAGSANQNASAIAIKTDSTESALNEALISPRTSNGLDTELSLSHLNTTEAATALLINLAVQASGERVGDGAVDLLFAIYDEKGKLVERVRSEVLPAPHSREIHFTHRLDVAPGLYHVRAVVRDKATGEIRTARKWVYTPDVAKGEFSLSSLLVGEVGASTGGESSEDGSANGASLKASHRFEQTSNLRVVFFVYNASRPRNSVPDVSLKLEVSSTGVPNAPVFQADVKKMSVTGVSDLKRLPYAAEISLRTLPPGPHLLVVRAFDNLSKKTAVESLSFTVR